MNGTIPLVGQAQLMMIDCPGPAPHIASKHGTDQVHLCRFCGGFGKVLVNPRDLKILAINNDEPHEILDAEAVTN